MCAPSWTMKACIPLLWPRKTLKVTLPEGMKDKGYPMKSFFVLRFFYHILPSKKSNDSLTQAIKNDWANLYAYAKQIFLCHRKILKIIAVLVPLHIAIPIMPYQIDQIEIIYSSWIHRGDKQILHRRQKPKLPTGIASCINDFSLMQLPRWPYSVRVWSLLLWFHLLRGGVS